MNGLRPICVALLVLMAGPGRADGPSDLKAGPVGRVTEVIDGDTVRVLGHDADVRLIGLQAPKLPLGRAGFKAWPLADEAKAALSDLVEGREVALRLGETARDRNGRTLAHVVRDDGTWVQDEMLRRGWARVYTFPDNRRLAAQLYAAEAEARAASRGIWSRPFYAVRAADPMTLRADIGSFQIVAGRVVDAARVRERVYLNFGADFRTDFTVSLDRDAQDLFAAAGLDPLALEGRIVEARGWLTSRNGPMIEATHPEQVVVLSAD
ncbi:MAG: thermonuclease family protein [Rhodospirillaceae bacterium]|nr:thermonuclease family protein [Rhodospirillaceae bacterium]